MAEDTYRPFVSIIVPIYNAEDYLVECIESVKKQTLDNWELILVDDGSLDASGEIIDKYALDDKRIIAIHKENGGEFSSRLRGIENAKGKYVTGLDADDYYERTRLEVFYNALKGKEYDVVMGSLTMFEGVDARIQLQHDCLGEYDGEKYLRYVLKTTLHSFCTKFIKTEIIREVDYSRIPKSARMSEDYLMVIPALCKTKNALVIDDYTYMYRIRSNSTSHAVSYKNLYDLCEVSCFGVETLKENGYSEKDIFLCEHIGFLHCLIGRFIDAIKGEAITKEQFNSIRNHLAYVEARDAEKIRFFGIKKVIKMKLIRYGFFDMIRAL